MASTEDTRGATTLGFVRSLWSRGQSPVFREGTWVLLGQIGTAIGALLGVRVLTQLVTREVFGFVSLALGGVVFVSQLVLSPYLQVAVREVPGCTEASQMASLRSAVRRRRLQAAFASILLLGAVVLPTGTSAIASFALWLVVGGLACVDMWRNEQMAFLNASRQQSRCSTWNIADTWARLLAAVCLAYLLGGTALVVLSGYLIGTILVALRYVLHQDPHAVQAASRPAAGDLHGWGSRLTRLAMPLMPLALFGWVTGLGDRYVVASLVSVEEAGTYAATYALVTRPLSLIGGVLLNTLRPVYYEAVAAGNRSRSDRVLKVWIRSTIGVGVAVTVAVFFLRNAIVSLLLAPQYRTGVHLIPWLAAGQLVLTLAQIYQTVCIAHRRTHYVTISEGVSSAVALVSCVLLASVYGALGVAIAAPVYYGAQTVTAYVLARFSRDR